MYQRILVPVDGSPTSTAGLQEALKLARLTRGRLSLVHVVDELSLATGFQLYGAQSPDLMSMLEQAGQKVLHDARALAAAADVEVDICLIETMAERVAQAVLHQAEAWHADLIVLGTHGRRGVMRLVLGSDAEQILRASPVPVLLVRAKHESAPALSAATSEPVPVTSPV